MYAHWNSIIGIMEAIGVPFGPRYRNRLGHASGMMDKYAVGPPSDQSFPKEVPFCPTMGVASRFSVLFIVSNGHWFKWSNIRIESCGADDRIDLGCTSIFVQDARGQNLLDPCRDNIDI